MGWDGEWVSSVGRVLAYQALGPWVPLLARHELGVTVLKFQNLEVGAGGSKVQGHSQLCNELEGNLGYSQLRNEFEGEEGRKREKRKRKGEKEREMVGGREEREMGGIQWLTTGWTSDP